MGWGLYRGMYDHPFLEQIPMIKITIKKICKCLRIKNMLTSPKIILYMIIVRDSTIIIETNNLYNSNILCCENVLM